MSERHVRRACPPTGRTTVTTRQTLQEDPSPGAFLAASGVRIETIGVGTALTFLERLGKKVGAPGTPDHAWGAFQDAATLIGVAVLAISGPSTGYACVAVVPERRRLRVGSDLL